MSNGSDSGTRQDQGIVKEVADEADKAWARVAVKCSWICDEVYHQRSPQHPSRLWQPYKVEENELDVQRDASSITAKWPSIWASIQYDNSQPGGRDVTIMSYTPSTHFGSDVMKALRVHVHPRGGTNTVGPFSMNSILQYTGFLGGSIQCWFILMLCPPKG